jgi:hypothetical protein
MKDQTAKVLEEKLKRLGYREIAEGLANTGAEILLHLLDSKSTKVGNTAADFLAKKRGHPLLISAIMEDKIRTKLGKIRASNILFGLGRKNPEALDAHLKLLRDKNVEVADNALLALVAWGDCRVIPAIKERQATVKSVEDAKEFQLACEAIEKSNLAIFSPHFSFSKDAWK